MLLKELFRNERSVWHKNVLSDEIYIFVIEAFASGSQRSIDYGSYVFWLLINERVFLRQM